MRYLLFVIFYGFVFSSCIANANRSPMDFFSQPAISSVTLSPDGEKIAMLEIENDVQLLTLTDLNSKKRTILLDIADFSKNDAHLRAITWIDKNYLAAQFFEIKKGIKDLLDTKGSYQLLIIKVPSKNSTEAEVFSVRTKGWLVDPLVTEPGLFLYAKTGIYSKIYKLRADQLQKHDQKLSKLVKTDGGQFIKQNEIASTEGFVTQWFISPTGKPIAALKYLTENEIGLEVLALDKKNTKKDTDGKDSEDNIIKKWTTAKDSRENGLEKRILPIALSEDENTFYCLDFSEEEERSVYKVNFVSGEEKLVFEAGSYKIIDLILSKDNKLLGAKLLHQGGVRHVYLDQKDNRNDLAKLENDLTVNISNSINGVKSLYYTESHNQSGQFILKNNMTHSQTTIGKRYPDLPEHIPSRLIESSIEVEGIEIPYLLTLPENKSKKYRLIVLPHGGPIGVFDDRYFDPTTQFLAANGFAVLRVNFRGSSGYTAKLREAGKKQWGELMLKDIYEATQIVASRQDIHQDKICIVGMSYGGYAATMLTIKYPETYKCGVNIAGVSDINLYLNAPNRTEVQQHWLNENVGDPVVDFEKLKSLSPLYQIKNLQRPLLIMHGTKDKVVDIEHAYRLKLMLDKYNKKYDWQEFAEGQHDFKDIKISLLMFNRLLEFVQSSI